MRRRLLALGLFGVLALTAAAGSPRAANLTEHEVKAAFLFNFAKFVTWPEDVLPDDGRPFEIGIVGDDRFADVLEATVEGKSVGGHPIRIARFHGDKDVRSCPILYFDQEGPHPESAESWFRTRGILTVGDMPGFARDGGIIGFFFDEKRVRFEVNTAAAEDGRLRISSQLLNLARIVAEEGR